MFVWPQFADVNQQDDRSVNGSLCNEIPPFHSGLFLSSGVFVWAPNPQRIACFVFPVGSNSPSEQVALGGGSGGGFREDLTVSFISDADCGLASLP